MKQKDALSLQSLAIALVVGIAAWWLASAFVSFLFAHWKLILLIVVVALGAGLYFATRRP
jgi:uncharacterized membrane protein